MPEVRLPSEIHKAVDLLGQNSDYSHSGEAIRMLNEVDVVVIGAGAECVVLDGGESLRRNGIDMVVAIRYDESRGGSPEEMKREFYLHRVMEALFPHNFPHFYAAYGKTEGGLVKGISYRQKISLDWGKNAKFGYSTVISKGAVARYPFDAVREAIEELDLPVRFDKYQGNFAIGEDGGEYYMDSLWTRIGSWDGERIDAYMQDEGYSEQSRRLVQQSIERLEELEERWW